MISTSPFSNLPPELILEVFKAADDFSVVVVLAQTARIFYYTWRHNLTSICRAVASRVIWNPTDAERLLDMQEEADAVAEPVSQTLDGRTQKFIVRAKRLQYNARCASVVSEYWVDSCEEWEWHGREDEHMRPSELARFEHAFYCVWTIGVMGNTPHLRDQASAFLDKCSTRELFQLCELIEWTINKTTGRFGIPGFNMDEDKVWNTGYDLVAGRWHAYTGCGYSVPPAPGFPESPMNSYAFFDHTQGLLEYFPDK